MPDPVATVLRVSTQTIGLDAIGASQTVTATVLDQNNQAMAATVNWSSANPLVATVDANGRITAVDNGAAIITAQVSNLTAQVGVTVEQVAAGLELSASSLELDEATPSTVLEAVLVDAQGVAMDDDGIAWASSDTLIAGVEQSGRVTAIRRGEAVTTATSGAFEASATVNVLLPYRITMIINTELLDPDDDFRLHLEDTSATIYWGDLGLQDVTRMFWAARNLTEVPSTLEGLEQVTSLDYMFVEASAFTQDLSGWDVSNITSMAGLFAGATNFNGDVSTWDVSNVVNMVSMFSGNRVFNQDISEWNTANVDNFGSMFRGAESFNQNVGDWDVSSGFQFGGMFEGASRFDQDISGWDVSSARAMIQMFKNARSFNQNLRGWCVSRIDNEPFEFDLGASAWRLPESRPQWGRAC